MPKFAANLSMMFQEVGFLERFERAADAGFAGVEFLFPYDFDKAELAERLNAAALTQALFNLPPGDWAKGDRGLGALPGREADFAAGLDRALDYAAALGCERLHCMSGIPSAEMDSAACETTLVANLRSASPLAAARGVTLLLEPINSRDIPGYFLNFQEEGRHVIEAVGAPNLKLQLDLYHCQIMEGDLAMHIREFLPVTGHIQIAGVPERHEPDIGEVNYRYLFDLLDELGYDGWIGCEYRPRGRTEDGLDWFKPYRRFAAGRGEPVPTA